MERSIFRSRVLNRLASDEMACNLCHEPDGHKTTCPALIHVAWSASRHVPGSIWETLAYALFEEFVTASYASLTDRSSSDDERKFDAFVRHCKQALDDGDPYTVLELIRNGRG